MEPKNAYPNVPTIPYIKTTVDLNQVLDYIDTLTYSIPVKRMTACIFREESGNGQHGVNNNYVGLQADGSQIGSGLDSKVTGTCVKIENGTGKQRRFCCFSDFKPCIDYLAIKVAQRGLYIGGETNNVYSHLKINDVDTLDLAYVQEWVQGNINAKPTPGQKLMMEQLYASEVKRFPDKI